MRSSFLVWDVGVDALKAVAARACTSHRRRHRTKNSTPKYFARRGPPPGNGVAVLSQRQRRCVVTSRRHNFNNHRNMCIHTGDITIEIIHNIIGVQWANLQFTMVVAVLANPETCGVIAEAIAEPKRLGKQNRVRSCDGMLTPCWRPDGFYS